MQPQLEEPFEIGNVVVRNRVLAAPLSGVSDLPFRQRTWKGGAGLVVSEMIASREFCHSSKESMQRALASDCGPKMLQLAGTEALYMAEAAIVAEGQGAEIVDINMGCPAKKVTGRASGSALMRDLDHAMTLVDATVKAVSLPVTLKMRLGWDDASINAPELARRAVDAGVQMITVHGRTRCQFYEGRADWAAVAAVRSAVDVPLVINGDICGYSSASEAMRLSGADAVMVGRHGYGSPWAVGDIVRQVQGEPLFCQDRGFDLAAYVRGHYLDLLNHYGERVGLRNARKHLGWYLDKHTNIDLSTRAAVLRSSDPDEVLSLMSEIFQNRRRHRVAA